MTLVIIGCGSSGSAIAEQLVKRGKVNKIKLLDIEINKANSILKNLKIINDKVEYRSTQVDARNVKKVEKNLKDARLVINAASPICNISIMKACLNSNTNYIDLASDSFKYPDMKGTLFDDQLKFHNDFVKKNLLALTNTGFSPGFTDILCKHVVTKNSLESLEYLKVYLCEKIESNKLVASWSPYTLLLETINPPTVYNGRKIINVNHTECSKIINFSDKIGEIKVRPVNGHPELRTIPDFIGIPINYLEIGGGFLINDMTINDIIVELLRKQVAESSHFKGDIFKILSSSFEDPDNFILNYNNGIIKNEIVSCLFEIKGKINNKILEYRALIEHDLKEVIKTFFSGNVASFMVSIVPSIVTEKILSNEITERGVIAPAGLSSASEILEECKNMGLNFKEYSD